MSIIGIDIGTSSCCVAVLRNNVPEVIANEVGNRTTPGCIAFTDDEVLVGEPAQRQAMDHPANTVYGIKRLIGAKFSDPAIQSMKKEVPFAITQGDNDTVSVTVKVKGKNKTFTATALLTFLLEKMVSVAEGFAGQECKNCVLSIPALFTEQQISIYRTAAKMAKLNVLKFIKEATASAIAYGIDEGKGSSNVVVFDMGGHTCDVTVIRANEGMMMLKEITSANNLGGDNFDTALVQHFAKDFEKKNKVVIQGEKGDTRAIKKLTAAVQRVKFILSSQASADLECDSLFKGKDLFTTLSRARMEQITGSVFKGVCDSVKKCLANAEEGLSGTTYTHLILAGGASQCVKVRETVVDLVPGAIVLDTMQPEEVVAYGCAVQASILQQSCISKPVEEKKYEIPTLASSIGIESEDGVTVKVLSKGTPLPCSAVCTVSASKDQQKDMRVQVYEGERALSKHNTLIVQVTIPLDSVSKSKSLKPLIFSVSADGSLSINQTATTENKDGEAVVAVPFASSSSPSPSPASTAAETLWDKAVLSWISKKRDTFVYVNGIVDGMVKTGTLKTLDPANSVSDLCDGILKYMTATVIHSGDSTEVEKQVEEVVTKQKELAALVQKVLLGNVGKKDEESDDDEGDESEEESDEESEDEALD